jgi:hypothetical protein
LAQNKTIYEQRKRHEYQTHIDFGTGFVMKRACHQNSAITHSLKKLQIVCILQTWVVSKFLWNTPNHQHMIIIDVYNAYVRLGVA